MEVVGENYRSDGLEWPLGACRTKRTAQVIDVFHQQRTIPLLQVHRKEIGSARNPDTSVVGRAASVADRLPDRSQRTSLYRVGKVLRNPPAG